MQFHWFSISLGARITLGATIFLTLAAVDLKQKGRKATRWREYLFLVACVALAMAYGVANDLITSRISWEYFYFGKELERVLGPGVPPDPVRMSCEAAKIGMGATWTVGLLLGAAILIANNPRDTRAQLSYRSLLRLLPIVLIITVMCAAIGGWCGSMGWLNWISADFEEMWRNDIFRPKSFMTTWGAHLGGYVGGLLGGILAVYQVMRCQRRKNVMLA